ncbi:rhotekin-2 isoform X4 [Dermatophagoides farinae]|uniref:rhotekin-2 isoform X4 n=1 Tax=Dermatophagoides farinae TaxID=6954 RepID=UPI003F61E53E
MHRYIYSIVDHKTSFCYVDTMEYDLQQKIDLEIKMREGTAKLLAACKHMNQSLEAAKSLLTSDMRLAEFRNELQKRKQRNNNNNHHQKLSRMEPVFKAKSSVSDIRIPLIWKDSDYFKNKGDYRRFAVFCLLKIGTEIYDTIMVNVDRNITDICFDDTFHFNCVEPNFTFDLYIYARILHDDLSMASTHKKLTHKISNSLSRSFGRKMINYKDDFDPETGPKFYLIARSTLNLKDSADLIKTYDLDIEEELDKNLQLPLFGHFCCRLAVQPECLLKDYRSGIVRSIDSNEMFWSVLAKFKLNLWHMKTELKDEPAYLKHTASKRTPNLIIPINNQTKISQQKDQTALIQLINNDITFTFESINDQHNEWFRCLNKCREDFIAWQPIAEYNMELAPISHHRSQYLFHDRPTGTSLYNETSIQDYEFRKQHHHHASFSHPHNNNNNHHYTGHSYSLSSKPV